MHAMQLKWDAENTKCDQPPHGQPGDVICQRQTPLEKHVSALPDYFGTSPVWNRNPPITNLLAGKDQIVVDISNRRSASIDHNVFLLPNKPMRALSISPSTAENCIEPKPNILVRTNREHRASLLVCRNLLCSRPVSLTMNETSLDDDREPRSQPNHGASNQVLELRRVQPDEAIPGQVFRVGKIIADDNSDQVVLATKMGIFEVEEASATNKVAQLIASTTDATAQRLSTDRYSSRFGTSVNIRKNSNLGSSTPEQPRRSGAAQKNASANETKKRVTEIDSTEEGC